MHAKVKLAPGAGPLAREEPECLLVGYGYKTHFVEGEESEATHHAMAATLDAVIAEIKVVQRTAWRGAITTRPRWPMIVLATPKGSTGPIQLDGRKTESLRRSHQMPLGEVATNPAHLAQLEQRLRSYATWVIQRLPENDHLAPQGRIMEILSEHTCQGWLEGYPRGCPGTWR